MSREHIEIGIELLYIHPQMRYGLCAVHQDRNPLRMSVSDHFTHRINRPQYIRDMGDTDQTSMPIEKRLICIDVQISTFVDGNYPELDIAPALQKLPRHDIGMVFHNGENNLVAVVQELISKRRSHQIDCLRCSSCKNNFRRRTGPDELLHPTAGSFVGIGSLLTKRMDSTMHICIYPIVSIGNMIDHTLGSLRRSAVIQID